LLAKRKVKIAGYFFLRIYGPGRKKERTRISRHLDQTSLVNTGFIIGDKEQFFLRDTAQDPEQAR